ncbi:MAG: crossover junction endodeoxyribonuclease RuvC [Mucinivorans sp.]
MAIHRVPFAARDKSSLEGPSVGATMEGRVVIGIDPGTNFMGYAVVRFSAGQAECLVMGTINLSRFKDRYRKLHHIFERVSSLVAQYSPNEMALEAPFYGVNVQSMLKLGRAQGVAMAAALARDVDVIEYEPTRVKQANARSGRAIKEQVAGILHSTLGVELGSGEKLDATDALSVAMCHIYTQNSPVATREKSGTSSEWATFLSQNPDRKA